MLLDQVRARNAFGFVLEGVQADSLGDFLQLARKLPAMLQTNGFLATWAHLLAKNEVEHKEMAKAFLRHFRDAEINLVADRERDAKLMFIQVWTVPGHGVGAAGLQKLTAEAVVFAVWLKRAAEALCDTGQTAVDQGGGQ
jgi:CRISPR/Cas system CMR-associated protein Cmr5 small subunit